MKSLFARFMNDESGATAIEYGLIAALISISAISAMVNLGNALVNTLSSVSGQVSSAQNSTL